MASLSVPGFCSASHSPPRPGPSSRSTTSSTGIASAGNLGFTECDCLFPICCAQLPSVFLTLTLGPTKCSPPRWGPSSPPGRHLPVAPGVDPMQLPSSRQHSPSQPPPPTVTHPPVPFSPSHVLPDLLHLQTRPLLLECPFSSCACQLTASSPGQARVPVTHAPREDHVSSHVCVCTQFSMSAFQWSHPSVTMLCSGELGTCHVLGAQEMSC